MDQPLKCTHISRCYFRCHARASQLELEERMQQKEQLRAKSLGSLCLPLSSFLCSRCYARSARSACESIGAGTTAIVAYNQKLLDEIIGVDGNDEIALYLAPVGKVE